MTGRTTPPHDFSHGLTVLEGGLSASRNEFLDEQLAVMDADWLSREIEEASAFCDALEAAGKRVAFTLHGTEGQGLQAAVRNLVDDAHIRDLDAREVVDIDRLLHTNGLGGEMPRSLNGPGGGR